MYLKKLNRNGAERNERYFFWDLYVEFDFCPWRFGHFGDVKLQRGKDRMKKSYVTLKTYQFDNRI